MGKEKASKSELKKKLIDEEENESDESYEREEKKKSKKSKSKSDKRKFTKGGIPICGLFSLK